MKKLIALFVICGLLVGIAGVYTVDAAAAKKAPAKKVVKKKVVKKAVKKAAPKKAAPTKAVPVAPVAPPPPLAPVVPPAPRIVAKPAAPAGLLGLGINTSATGLYIYSGDGSLKGSVGAKGSLVLEDIVGLGPMVGLSASAVKYTVGLGYVAYGSGGLQAFPIYGGGIISLPAELMGGLETYLVGGVNYVIYGNGKTTGKIGGDAGIGVKVDLGLGLDKTGIELGYGYVRSNTVSRKGLILSVSQPIVL